MPRKKIKLDLTWEIEVCAFTLAIVLTRIQPDIFTGFSGGVLHKFTAQELVAYCAELEWGSEVDLRVGQSELMHGIHLFNSGNKKVLECYFHLTVEDKRGVNTPEFGTLTEKTRSWEIIFQDNFQFSLPNGIKSKKSLLAKVSEIRNKLLLEGGYSESNLNSLSEVYALPSFLKFKDERFTSPTVLYLNAEPETVNCTDKLLTSS